MACTKDYTSLAVVILFVCAGSGLELIGEGGSREENIDIESAADDPVTADEHNGAREEGMSGATGSSSSHRAASDVAELVQRKALFSHPLNQFGDEEERLDEALPDRSRRRIPVSHSYSLNLSSHAPVDGSGGEQRVRVFEGLAGLVRSMILFSHALNLSTDESKVDTGEEEVTEALTDLVERMTLFSHALDMSIAEADGSTVGQRITKGLADLMDRVILFSYALNQTGSGSTAGGGDGEEERVRKGLADLVERMTLLAWALNRSNDDAVGGGDSGTEDRVREDMLELMQRMVLFSHALNMSKHEHESSHGSNGGGEQSVMDGLRELVGRMRLLSEALTSDHIQLLRPPVDASDLGNGNTRPPFQ